MDIPMYPSWEYEYWKDEKATEEDEWWVARHFVDICSKMTAKLIGNGKDKTDGVDPTGVDPTLSHPASIAFANVLSFFLAIPFHEDALYGTVTETDENDVTTKYNSPVADLKQIVSALVAAGRQRDKSFDVTYPVGIVGHPGRYVPAWSPIQCYLQVMMDDIFSKLIRPDFNDLDALKAVLRTLLQDQDSLYPDWYGTGMPSCLFLYQLPQEDEHGRVLVFTSDCQWGCLRGLDSWARRARMSTLPQSYQMKVVASTNAIRNLYNSKLINYDGRNNMVTISDEEKRDILMKRFNPKNKDAADWGKNNKIICTGAKPIFEQAKKDYLDASTKEYTRYTWTVSKTSKAGKAQAFKLPFRADKAVRARCPRCRVVFNLSLVDESDEVVDWLETVYPGTPCSCAEVVAMYVLGGVETVIESAKPTETTTVVPGQKYVAVKSAWPRKKREHS